MNLQSFRRHKKEAASPFFDTALTNKKPRADGSVSSAEGVSKKTSTSFKQVTQRFGNMAKIHNGYGHSERIATPPLSLPMHPLAFRLSDKIR
jgi:hypothetical protein